MQPAVNAAPRRVVVGHGNSFHDQAIAILEPGFLFAEALERPLGVKRAVGIQGLLPIGGALRRSLAELGYRPVETGEIVVRTSWRLPPGMLGEIQSQVDWTIPARDESRIGLARHAETASRLLLASARCSDPLVAREIASILCGESRYPFETERPSRDVPLLREDLEHHLAHAAAAVYTSPFEECVAMVIDGFGESGALSFYHFADGRFHPLSHTPSPRHSLGRIYTILTLLCGFCPYSGEHWKTMGLAAYGRPVEAIRAFFRDRTAFEDLHLRLDLDGEDWIDDLESLAGPFRRPEDPDTSRSADLAHNFQRWFAETVVELARRAGELGLSKNLAYAGGCALNSATNGLIVPRTAFERLHVPCAPADDGNALGAALYEAHAVQGLPRRPDAASPYLGSRIPRSEIDRIAAASGYPRRSFDGDEAGLCEAAAGLLAGGAIVGWIQGRAEFGPRALGNRSILADPRDPAMKAAINDRVKFREPFRPVGPSILDEFGDEYFLDYQTSPFMERALLVRPERRSSIPAATHVDGTARVHSVTERSNPTYARLLRAFHARTGVPALVNTSFNVMGRPISHSATDALAVFATTGLDHLVLGSWILSKPGVVSP